MGEARVAAVDIGGTRLKLGVVDATGAILHTALAPTEADRPGLLARVIDLVATVVDDYQPAAVGVATAGIVDTARGCIIGGNANLPGWIGTDVVGGIRERLGLPAAVDNDVNAAALGEFWHGAGQGADPLLVVMVGTGLGAGLIVGGRIYRGAHYGGLDIGYEAVPNVPVGYLPNPHAAECCIGLAGLRYLIREARAEGRRTLLDADSFQIQSLFLASSQGDMVALELQARLVSAVTTVLTNLCYVLDPARLLLGGGVIDAGGEALFRTVAQGVRARLTEHRLPHFDLRPLKLGELAGVFGAARLALDLVGA